MGSKQELSQFCSKLQFCFNGLQSEARAAHEELSKFCVDVMAFTSAGLFDGENIMSEVRKRLREFLALVLATYPLFVH
jgi:regulator of sigma D